MTLYYILLSIKKNTLIRFSKNLLSLEVCQKKTVKSLKPVSTRPAVMYGSCKVHKASVESCPPFRPNFSALNTPTYKLTKFLVPLLNPLTTNEFKVKDPFHFADLFMGSLDVDFLLTNMHLVETIEICANELFKKSETAEGLSKTEFKELLSLATKEIHFLFDGTLYKQIDGVAMGSPLGPTLANVFLVYHQKSWLKHCSLESRSLCYRRYVDDIFVLFNSAEHLKPYLNSCHLNMSFTMENEKDNRMSFLDVNMIRGKNKFATFVYCKPTFSGIYTHFNSFLPSGNKIGLLHTLLHKSFRICSV